MTTINEIDDQLARLNVKRAHLIKERIGELDKLRRRIDDEIAILMAELSETEAQCKQARRRSPLTIPECGTETGYQRHRNRGEKCVECRAAHAAHNRAEDARRRIARVTSEQGAA